MIKMSMRDEHFIDRIRIDIEGLVIENLAKVRKKSGLYYRGSDSSESFPFLLFERHLSQCFISILSIL